MKKRAVGRVVLGLFLGLGGPITAFSCGTDTAAPATGGCALNSDCASPLVCVYARCHKACANSADCPTGQRCVAGDSASAPNVCQLPIESSCADSSCTGNQVCTQADKQCRAPCQTSSNCAPGDICELAGSQSVCFVPTNSSDQGVLIEAGVLEAGSIKASGDGSTGTPGDSGNSGAGDTSMSSSSDSSAFDGGVCTVHFGGIATGDTRPSYMTGIGARTPTGLLLIDGYGAPDGDGGQENCLDAQMFTSSGASLGAASLALVTRHDEVSGPGDFIQAAATSPDGTTAVVFYDQASFGNSNFAPEVAFFAPDLHPLGLTQSLGPARSVVGQPDIQWVNDRFVMAWTYVDAPGWAVKVAMFGADGTMITGIGPVHTDDPADHVWPAVAFGLRQDVSLAASGNVIAVAYRNVAAGYPMMSMFDLNANPIGSPIQIAAVPSYYGLAIGGTAHGFVAVWHEYKTMADAGLLGDGIGHVTFVSLTGTVGTSIRLPGGTGASQARGSSDGTRAGFALLFEDGVRFGSALDDLSTGFRISSAIPSGGQVDNNDDQIAITASTGTKTFGLSFFSRGEHRTRAVAEGCSLAGAADAN